jgi:hypothetical protein
VHLLALLLGVAASILENRVDEVAADTSFSQAISNEVVPQVYVLAMFMENKVPCQRQGRLVVHL